MKKQVQGNPAGWSDNLMGRGGGGGGGERNQPLHPLTVTIVPSLVLRFFFLVCAHLLLTPAM